MRNSITMTAMAAVIGIAIASPVFAQGMGMGMGGGMGMGPVAKLCAKDMETHCPGIPHGPELRSCLEAKSKNLSENCQTALESTGANRGPGTGPVARLCMVEISKFCPEVEHVNGKVRDCLGEHRSELGEACTTALDTTGRGRH